VPGPVPASVPARVTVPAAGHTVSGMPWPRTCAVLISAVAAALAAACAALLVRWPDAGAVDTAVTVVVLVPAVALGLAIALRRPRVRIAPLLCLMGTVPMAVVALGDTWTVVTAAHPGALPSSPLLVGLLQGSWMLLYVPPALLLLTFPDGRLPGPRWRPVAVGVVAIPVAFALLGPLDPQPYPPPYTDVPRPWGPGPQWLVPVGFALLPVLLGLLVAAAAAPVVRYRRAGSPVVRAQLRWFALGAMLLPATLLLCWLSYLLLGTPDLVPLGLALTVVLVPVATTVALLRHDLYDVDRAFSATVAYGLVTAVLLTVFTAVEVAGGLVLGRGSALAAAVATALSALALAPLRTRLQRATDRRFNPLRQSVRAALDDLRDRIDDGRARPEDLEATLRTALRDPGLRLGYVLPGRPGHVDLACAPLPVGDGPQVAVRVGDTPVGVLLPTATAASRELLRETAAAVALVVEVIRSRLELTEALREVADSRARLLQAGYRERCRLERDLHDGAQQRLVSLGMTIRLAQRHLTDGGVDVDGLLDQAVAELGTAVAELRAIARGLRPLDLGAGLAPAIRSLTTAVPLPVTLDLDVDGVPDDVATTAYYVASEALANVVKHAGAENVAVSIARVDDRVRLRVRDDGRGGARARPGSGLAGLVDRVAAAGGRLSVGADAPRGTLVEAELPCAP
jgi:signal transduction histidine kinase